MLDPRIIPVPKKWNHERTVFEIKEFFPELAEMEPPPSKGRIAKIQIFCARCGKFHFIRWNEMQKAIRKGARSFDEIVIAFADKYCVQHVHIPPEEKPANLQKAEVLAAKLSALHPEVYVIEIVPYDRDYFGMKIQTPIAVYLDEGSSSDWMKLVKRDIEAASGLLCPFCKERMAWNSDSFRQCGSCGSIFRQNGINLIDDLDIADVPRDIAVTVLSRFKSFFVEDSAHSGWWGRLPGKCDPSATELVAMLDGITGPNASSGSLELPLLCNVENTDDDTLDAIRNATGVEELPHIDDGEMEWILKVPTCEFCRHAMVMDDAQSVVYGVESTYLRGAECHICVNPLVGEKVSDAFGRSSGSGSGLTLEPEELRGYQENVGGKIWNALVSRVLEGLIEVDEDNHDLEAQAGHPFNKFFGPICKDFVLNEEHISLDGQPYDALPLRTAVHFGVENLARKAKERDSDRKRQLWDEVEETIKKDGYAEILRTRVESKDVDAEVGQRLISLLEEIVPVDLRREGQTCAKLNRYLDLSHTAAAKIEAILVERAKNRK
jgi:hypothetical protein